MTTRATDPFPDAVTAFLALAWLGALLGVSFLATLSEGLTHFCRCSTVSRWLT